jgi:hypothetical protein
MEVDMAYFKVPHPHLSGQKGAHMTAVMIASVPTELLHDQTCMLYQHTKVSTLLCT